MKFRLPSSGIAPCSGSAGERYSADLTCRRAMRLLWTAEYWGSDAPGGSAESVRLLAKGVQALGHEVTILTPKWHAHLPDQSNLDDFDVRYYPVRVLPAGQRLAPSWVPGFDRATQRAVSALALTYDVVHAQDRRLLRGTVLGARGRPTALTVRDVGLLCPIATCLLQQRTIPADCGQRKLWRECGPWYQRHYAPSADLRRTRLKLATRYNRLGADRRLVARLAFVGFVSEGLAKVYLARGWPHWARLASDESRSVGVVPSPVETELSVIHNSSSPRVAFVGRRSLGKGWLTFDEARRRLALGFNQFVHIDGVGHEDALEMMCSVDVVAVPPLQCDALPRVALEAQALGKPVVATRVGGLPEIVDDGVTGLLVEPGDVAGLAEAIARLLQDPLLARQMGAAGRERMRRLFSPEACARRLMEAYISVDTAATSR